MGSGALDGVENAAAEAVRLARTTSDRWAHAPGSREVQRSGFLGQRELTGDLFVPLWIAEVLRRSGRDPGPDLEKVVELRPDGDIRYYRDCPTLPWDADDAAAVLLAWGAGPGWSGVALARAVLLAALDVDGAVRTWVTDPDHPERRPVGPWLGPVCNGVAARALRAMAADAAFEPAVVQRTARWLAARAEPDGGFLGEHYPSRVLVTALVLEALADAETDDGAAASAVERAAAWLAREQRPDGAIGRSALETGAALLALHRAGPLDGELATAAAGFLVGSQRWDGTWPESDLYLCPHPRGAIRPFRCATLASAMAFSALSLITNPATCP